MTKTFRSSLWAGFWVVDATVLLFAAAGYVARDTIPLGDYKTYGMAAIGFLWMVIVAGAILYVAMRHHQARQQRIVIYRAAARQRLRDAVDEILAMSEDLSLADRRLLCETAWDDVHEDCLLGK